MSSQVGVAAGSGLSFVSSDQVESAAKQSRPRPGHGGRSVKDDYETAQLRSLKAGLFTAALLALLALMSTRELPHDPPGGRRKEGDPELSGSPA